MEWRHFVNLFIERPSYTHFYKKSELMLLRCTRAYSSSYSQVILVYLNPFCRKSLFCSKNCQKLSKNLYFRVQSHRCWHS